MLIRCEKCSTLYELDDKLVPPQGAPVQCSKCQFVFKAYPTPQTVTLDQDVAANEPAPEGTPPDSPSPPAADDVARGGGVLTGVSSQEGGSSAPTPVPASPAEPPASRPVPASGGGGGTTPRPPAPRPAQQQFTADGRPIRKVPFPTAEPAPPGSRPVMARGPIGPGTPGAKPWLRWGIVVAAAVLLVVVAVLAWRAVRHRGSPDAQSRHPAGQSLLQQQGGTPEPLVGK